jgi:UDP-glucose 4-epimerase
MKITITGGTGSFGQQVTRHLLSSAQVQEIRIVSRDEGKQEDMRQRLVDPRLRYFIGDVRDAHSLRAAFRGAQAVFHAAALKQVPSCEFFPEQAVLTNVLGSENVLRVAQEEAVAKVVCLSTDKAVQPVNAMGMTKALMEKLVQAHARRLGPDAATTVCCVRYGNVLYSRGSVVPLFAERLLQGLPLPLTDPRMTRFLLPLSEAVGLVEVAMSHGRQGDTLIRKSAAADVATLVAALGQVMGVSPQVQHIGVRHGEKLHETLASSEEMAKAQDLGDHWRIPMDARGFDYRSDSAPGPVADTPPFSSDQARQLTVEQVVALLQSLPEMQAVLRQQLQGS